MLGVSHVSPTLLCCNHIPTASLMFPLFGKKKLLPPLLSHCSSLRDPLKFAGILGKHFKLIFLVSVTFE